ncbi:hypothetical protein LPJ59_003860, partial [Coemansia sp. RSA 2399]
MSDVGFNDDLLDKELFGGDSEDVDGMDVDEIIGMGTSAAGATSLGSIGANLANQNGGGATEADALAKGAKKTEAQENAGAGDDLVNSQQLPSLLLPRLVDIEMDVPPGEITVLAHQPHVRPAPPPELTS